MADSADSFGVLEAMLEDSFFELVFLSLSVSEVVELTVVAVDEGVMFSVPFGADDVIEVVSFGAPDRVLVQAAKEKRKAQINTIDKAVFILVPLKNIHNMNDDLSIGTVNKLVK